MNRSQAMEFIGKQKNGILTTLLKDGRPHSAPIVYNSNDGSIDISATWTRVKSKNIKRDPRANLCILPENGWFPYLTVEGACELIEDPDGTLNLDLYRRITGGDPDDPAEYVEAMASERRLTIHLSVDRIYPLDK